MSDTVTPTYAGPQRVFSGIQPTGNLHLGNYLGALKKFTTLQNDGWDGIYCVVDLHAITMPYERDAMASQTRQIAAAIAKLDAAKAESAAQVETKATELSNEIINKVVNV